jgi:hypothetical protein
MEVVQVSHYESDTSDEEVVEENHEINRNQRNQNAIVPHFVRITYANTLLVWLFI